MEEASAFTKASVAIAVILGLVLAGALIEQRDTNFGIDKASLPGPCAYILRVEADGSGARKVTCIEHPGVGLSVDYTTGI